MSRIKFHASLGILFCVFQNDLIARNAYSHINEWKKENITEGKVRQDYLPVSLESDFDFDDIYTQSDLSVEKNGYDKSYNGVTQLLLPMNTDEQTSVNTFDHLATGFHSVHVDLDLEECSNHWHSYPVRGSEGSILISLTPTDNSQTDSAVLICNIELQVPRGMVAHLQMINKLKVSPYRIILMDEENSVMLSDYVDSLLSEYFTYSSVVKFQLMTNIHKSPFQLCVNFTAITETSRPQLKTTFLSSTTGYIHTSQPSENRGYIPFINTWTSLVAAEDHAILINIYINDGNIYCFINEIHFWIIFHTETNSTEYKMCKLHKYTYTEPLIYHGVVRVQYKSFDLYERPFFKMPFSFHHVSALPVQLSEDRWNCSAVRWEDIQHHFPCNFVSNCVGGEDEAGCWPGDDTCSPGTFQADGRCFLLSRFEDKEMSWMDANEQCQQLGGQLPSLSTRHLWESVTEISLRIRVCYSILIGARSAPPTISAMYRNSWMWSDGTIAHFIKLFTLWTFSSNADSCATLSTFATNERVNPLLLEKCENSFVTSCLLCEIPGTSRPYENIEPPEIRRISTSDFKSAYVQCPDHHFTHVFLACDEASSCWSRTDGAKDSCSLPAAMSLPPPFKCAGVHESVPYTLVCDHRADCKDGSDEDFCYFPPCDSSYPFRCAGRKCIQRWERCNGQVDCDDRVDEDRCQSTITSKHNTLELELPLIIDLDSKGKLTFSPYNKLRNNLSSVLVCPDSHFTCVSLEQVCLPVYLRCNGINDCPGHEDEAACDRYTCPDFYRCRKSQVCVHGFHVCDGVYHCPQRDDEILCNETCPDNCVCHGLAYVCSGIFHAASFSDIRYLDARGTPMNLMDFQSNIYLVNLNLAGCNLTQLHEVTLPNLRILDLSSNYLTHIRSNYFIGLKSLECLKLSFNPLHDFYFWDVRQTLSLKILDLSEVILPRIDFSNFTFFSKLSTLNLSGSHLNHVTGRGIGAMNSLRILDLRLCPVTVFPREIFQSLTKLENIFADNYKLCCPVILPPGFNVLNCLAPSDEVSSCDDLLRSGVYRAGVAIFASLALLGNLSSLVYRLIFHKTSGNVGYDVFVTNLCVADFLMGLYLSIIGICDFRYRGSYVWEDVGWRNSSLCKLAGFTSLLSCEVSVFIIFLITCDRFLVLRFPFSQVHFGKRSAQCACAVSWFTGVALAVVPLLRVTSHWEFYSQTSICIPLPTSRVQFPGRMYAFGVIIILNLIFFILIIIGQALIYWSVHTNSISEQNTSKSRKEVTIARRLLTVVMSDFLCWFPVGLVGILASNGIPIPGEVNVVIAIFVLPINAAVNPFLYTINMYLEGKRRSREEERRKRIVDQLKFANGFVGNAKVTLTGNEALELIKTLISVQALSQKELQKLVQNTS